MKDYKALSLKMHEKLQGKIEIKSKVSIDSIDDLSWAYSPGVAEPCKAIKKNKETIYKYTSKANTIGVITDGTAVLGLGDIGPEAALPVMEGKSILFKRFAGINAIPLCLDVDHPDQFIETVVRLSPTLGGINLEDIASPNCVYIENALKKRLDIPVFHDDQHGTAVATAAALINAVKVVDKNLNDLKVALIGTGAAGSAIAKMLKALNIRKIHAYNKEGIIRNSGYHTFDFVIQDLLDNNIINTPDDSFQTLADIIKNKDVVIGVSVGNIITENMIKTMAKDPIVFAMANPIPEINPELAQKAGAKIIGTGRSDYPNQINNVLVFPGIFKGALEAKINNITLDMQVKAAYAIARVIPENALNESNIIPSVFNEKVVASISKAIANM